MGKKEKKIRDRKNKKKWESLRTRGYTPPSSGEENLRRLRAAHHGE